MDETSETCTIILTDQPPVLIREDVWPVIAHGSFRDYDGQYESEANHWWRVDIRVRQHKDDGRAIVYGIYDYCTAFASERVAHAGVMVGKGADLVRAIHAVGSDLMRATRDAARAAGDHTHDDISCAHIQIQSAVRECIADLPAVELE